MAKLGEGDPRWLVQDRADGTNVNGWHWVEKDALEWSKRRLSELFSGMSLPVGDGRQLSITGLDSCTGEAVINNRKQKIIPSYELEIKFNWEGRTSADGAVCQGKIHLPYLADENHEDDPDIRFALQADDAASNQLKAAFLQGAAKQEFNKRVAEFVKELRAGGPMRQGQQAGSGEADTTTTNTHGTQPKVKLSSADPTQLTSSSPVSKPATTATSSSKGSGKGRSLKLTEQFYCRTVDVYECFTAATRFQAFSQSPASIEHKVGGNFTWFGGSVQGVFSELEAGKRISMDWRFSSWEDGCFSKVVIHLEEPEPGHTILTLTQTGIPEADRYHNEDVYDNTDKGWRLQIFQRIRQVFGYGVGL